MFHNAYADQNDVWPFVNPLLSTYVYLLDVEVYLRLVHHKPDRSSSVQTVRWHLMYLKVPECWLHMLIAIQTLCLTDQQKPPRLCSHTQSYITKEHTFIHYHSTNFTHRETSLNLLHKNYRHRQICPSTAVTQTSLPSPGTHKQSLTSLDRLQTHTHKYKPL